MRVHSRWALGLLVGVLILAGTWLATAGATHAGGPTTGGGQCEDVYRIRRGDTLLSIARRHNTTVAELLRLNRGRIWNPNLIITGQRICLPSVATDNRLVVQVTYQFNLEDEERGWDLTTRGGHVGKRVTYELQPVGAVDLISTTCLLYTSPSPRD